MSYTCPDCEDGVLEVKVREIDLKLEDDETAHVAGGVALCTSVRCNNGCSSSSDEDEEDKPKTRKKRGATTPKSDTAMCQESEGCARPAGHSGNHYRKRAEA